MQGRRMINEFDNAHYQSLEWIPSVDKILQDSKVFRITQDQRKTLVAVWEDVFGKKFNAGCSSCFLTAFQNLKTMFNKLEAFHVEHHEYIEQELSLETGSESVNYEAPAKKKRTRKPKQL